MRRRRCSRPCLSARALFAPLLASLLSLAALPAAAAEPSGEFEFDGTWTNPTFGSSGTGGGTLSFDGLGKASFTFRTSHLCGVPGSFPLTVTGDVDPDDYSFTAAVTNHPIYGNVQVAVDPDGDVTGSATNAPGMSGGNASFTGKLRLAGNDVGLDLDVRFTCGFPGEIRSLFDLAAAAPCVGNATTLCLNDDRFKVTMAFRPRRQPLQNAKVAVQGTADAGLFYFFDPAAWEVLARVIDGCGINNRYWVFIASTTTVEYTITVTDTLRNKTKTYKNTQGRPAAPVQDTSAFATCP